MRAKIGDLIRFEVGFESRPWCAISKREFILVIVSTQLHSY